MFLLQDNVRSELAFANEMQDLGLSAEVIDGIADDIVAQILYAFRVDWDPDWVKPGRLHSWWHDGQCFARCPVCLLDSPGSSARAEAYRWVREHEESHRRTGGDECADLPQ